LRTPEAERDPGAQSRLFEHLLALLGRLSEEAPVLLALEDLHWADVSTQDLFSFLVRNLRGERIVLLATYRDDEVDRRHPLRVRLAQLERDRSIDHLLLPRFDRDEFDRQLNEIRRGGVAPALADRIFERSGGNPFFTEELLAIEQASDHGEVPPTVRDALLGRVERLDPVAQRLVGAAAVVGREVERHLLSVASGLAGAELDTALREATAAHVLVAMDSDPAERYAFRHALMQEALYAEVLPSERSRLHGVIAEALRAVSEAAGERHDEVAGALAFHWLRSGRWPEALTASLRAASAAADTYAFPEELAHLERALDMWPRVPEAARRVDMDLAEVAERAAVAADHVGDTRRAAALREMALK
jgi:predicted ATPase